jgi:hypothetical protein
MSLYGRLIGITFCRGEGGVERGGEPLWPPAGRGGATVSECDEQTKHYE